MFVIDSRDTLSFAREHAARLRDDAARTRSGRTTWKRHSLVQWLRRHACRCTDRHRAAGAPLGMKAILHQRYGRPDVLELRDVDKPTIGDDQVLVRVHASSVNPVEWYGVSGPYFARIGNGMRRPKDQTVGADLAGTVEAVGRNVKEPATGRRGVRRLGRVLGRVHDRARGPAREEALEPVVRGSGGGARGRGHGTPGAARQGCR